MKNIAPGLFLIDLDQPLKGFRQFISSWVYQRGETTIIIDPGPASTIPHLLRELQQAGLKHPDYILLTHIHIDHAGGAGLLLKTFPNIRILCHPKGIPHLINPEKLWNASLQILGELAETYGPIAPIPEEKLFYSNHLQAKDFSIHVFETPGHAAHHISFLIDDLLFVGEALGVNLPGMQGSYLRIATPPKFKYDIYRSSLERIRRLPAKGLCFGHYGYREDVRNVVNQAMNQLDHWMETVREALQEGITEEKVILEKLLKSDPNLKQFANLPADIQARERYFCKNSIKGMVQYLEEHLAEAKTDRHVAG